MGRFSRTLERLSTDNLEAGELKSEAAKAGCQLISSQEDRCMATIHGVLRSVTLRPVDGVTALEAELYDGSDSVTLVWLGRRKIEGIAALRDESDRDGYRVVVELRRDAVPDVVLNQLYRFTALQSSFGANMVALDAGRSTRVTFDVPAGRLGFTGRDGRFVVEPGAMTFLVGASWADVRASMTVDLTGVDDHPDPNTVAPCRHLIEGA